MDLFSTISYLFLNLKRQLKDIHEFDKRNATKLRLLKVKLHKLTVALLTYAVSEQLQQQQLFRVLWPLI
jgi:hypothetical protein